MTLELYALQVLYNVVGILPGSLQSYPCSCRVPDLVLTILT